MANFDFLQDCPAYALFAQAAREAERVYASAPAMCAVGCRKALELAVQWVYDADEDMKRPYQDHLQAMLHEPCFRFAVDRETWGKLPLIVKLGNLAVHTERTIPKSAALVALRNLFEFIQWIDYCYGETYEERTFSEEKIPGIPVVLDTKKIREQESLLGEKESEIEALRKTIRQMAAKITADKEKHRAERRFASEDLSEWKTRKVYIDVDLAEAGWVLSGEAADVREEVRVTGMEGNPLQEGFCDYVLYGKDGLPLAVTEAKRTSRDVHQGRVQASLYADCLEREYGRRPMVFTTNGFETFFWDDRTAPERRVSGFFSKEDLERLMRRREEVTPLDAIPIDDRITDRYYQKEAIRAVCAETERGVRKHLLVMATGTGKTRTAASLVDVLSRGKRVTNVLFLADRKALVRQAKDDFKRYLPHHSLCNLCENKDDRNARIIFSTYPTMLNAIDDTRSAEGLRLFSPAHFDLIIIDESHRSIFKKYRTIFEYFDAMLVGLTATPKTDVDRNTYDFFEMAHGVPTYAYDYETAVETDHVLVPYYNYEVKTKFLDEGIRYDELSPEDKERFEEDFEPYGRPDFVPSSQMNKFIFNEVTVDTVLQDLMDRGIRTDGGDRIGKTIIFAQGKEHAEFIAKRFNALYPQYKGIYIARVVCEDSYAQAVIDQFKIADKPPFIVVSVDMMDTGIDVPHCVNLVFFKRVLSKTKFWQMIGRGTRLCPDLSCVDAIDGAYTGKRRFLIFDYCGNFEYFREHREGYESKETKTLSETIFERRIRLITALQDGAYADESYRTWRGELAEICHGQVAALNSALAAVKLHRRYVETYKKEDAFVCLSEGDVADLTQFIAPLVQSDDTDEAAKRFDSFMYGLMLAAIEGKPSFARAKRELAALAAGLEKKASIPQVRDKLPLIRDVQMDAFSESKDILLFERVRRELRGLMQFLDREGKAPIMTSLTDPITDRREGEALETPYDFEDYQAKVNRYVNEHADSLVIYKLTHNIRLTQKDYEELSRVLTSELGSESDYRREYGEMPFGLLIRKIAKLDHEAAMQAFSSFINDESLNASQIAFVRKIIRHVEQNGYMENVTELQKPPFDKPINFIKLFDAETRTAILQTIKSIKENAEPFAG